MVRGVVENAAKERHPSGERVVVTFDGKFLPYEWTSAQP
jgi:cyanate lyase